ESEHKLDVPAELLDAVWGHLQERYADPQAHLGSHGGAYRAEFAQDRFIDQYFDTTSLDLLHRQGGVRHRQRFVMHGDDAKDGRELIQVKLSRPGDLEVNRTEIKFPVRASRNPRRLDDGHPLVGLIRRSRREAFHAVIA